MFACIYGKGSPVLACAREFSPQVEETAPDTAIIDIRGLGRLFGSPEAIAGAIRRRAAETGLEVSVGVASNPDAAFHAARGFAGITVVESGEQLGSLPVELLSPPPEILETLDRWGIRTFRDLAALPPNGVSERLGPEGVRLQKLARGAAIRPLRPACPEPVFEEFLELESPVALLEPLAFVLARLLNRLCEKLAAHGLAACELRLVLRLEDRTEHARGLGLPVPMRHPRAFLKLLQLDLEAHPPQAPVVAVTLAATPAHPRTHQEGLFTPLSPEPEKLEITLARIQALVGESNVGTPELLDTNRPGAFRMRKAFSLVRRLDSGEGRRLAFRAFRPPRPAAVRLVSGQPAYVSAPGARGKVIAAAGPWRTSGDWWTPQPWARDEWDVELSDGVLCRLCREGAGWFLEGVYD